LIKAAYVSKFCHNTNIDIAAEVCMVAILEQYGIKNYEHGVSYSGIILLLSFMKINKFISKCIKRNRYNGVLNLTFIMRKEGRLRIDVMKLYVIKQLPVCPHLQSSLLMIRM
jgi:hypothetical protein